MTRIFRQIAGLRPGRKWAGRAGARRIGALLLAAAAGAAAQGPAGTVPPAPRTQVARFVVVLDAAHGGDDSGAQLADSVAEKNVTLALSVRLRSLLTARGFSVTTTREGNVNVDSDGRAQIANHAVASASGASACLSLHASEAGAGVHIFVSSLGAAPATRFLAWKTAQAAYVNRSLKLAGTMNSAFEHSSLNGAADGNAGPIPATLARASLPGVDSMTCPAVAIEMAPIRDANHRVATEVTDPGYQQQVVEALAAALLEWKTDGETEGRLP